MGSGEGSLPSVREEREAGREPPGAGGLRAGSGRPSPRTRGWARAPAPAPAARPTPGPGSRPGSGAGLPPGSLRGAFFAAPGRSPEAGHRPLAWREAAGNRSSGSAPGRCLSESVSVQVSSSRTNCLYPLYTLFRVVAQQKVVLWRLLGFKPANIDWTLVNTKYWFGGKPHKTFSYFRLRSPSNSPASLGPC